MRIIILVFTLFLFFSCHQEVKENKKTKHLEANNSQSNQQLSYAKGFELKVEGNIQKLIIKDPFNGYTTQKKYALVHKKDNYTPKKNEIVLTVPLKRVIPFSTSFLSMIDTLGEINSIVGVENKSYIYNPKILNKIEEKKVGIIGSIGQLDLEKVLSVNPQVLISIGSTGETPKTVQKLEKARIISINNYDWQEKHPLGKAEWIKFFGALYDKQDEATKIFNFIASNYTSLKNRQQQKPVNVLFSSPYSGTWYIPGGKSYGAQFLKDANGTYAWSKDTSTGSLPLSFETIVNQQKEADIWLSPNYNSITEMVSDDSRYLPFLNKVENRVYSQNKRINSLGGNDYWEKGALRPDLVLKDYIELFKLDNCISDSLFFFEKLDN